MQTTQNTKEINEYAVLAPIEAVQEVAQKQCKAVQNPTVQTIKQIEIVDNTKVINAVVEVGVALCGLAVTVIQSLSESIADHVERKRRMRYLGKLSEADRARTRQYLQDCSSMRKEAPAKFNIQINGGENNITINS